MCSCERMWPKCGLYRYLPLIACIVDNKCPCDGVCIRNFLLVWGTYMSFFLSFHLKCYVDAGTKININVVCLPDICKTELFQFDTQSFPSCDDGKKPDTQSNSSLVQVILVCICNISAFILQDNWYWSKNKVTFNI